MVGTETLNLFQWSGWRLKTHSHCRINCEKLVEGWLRSRPSILLLEEQWQNRRVLKNEYYIVSAYEDNYLHLTGLHTILDAATFFEKCYKGILEQCDFDFCKSGQSESEVKGSVRRKINSLPSIMDIFNVGTFVEEDFEKNRIRCTLAVANVSVTLGFVVAGRTKPMTLLKGNELNSAKAKKLDLVLRRKSGESRFTEILVGDGERLAEHKDELSGLLSEELLALITTDEKTEE